jgi:CheY-like chemotaxis protein
MGFQKKIRELEEKLQAMEDRGLEKSTELTEDLAVFGQALDQMVALADEILLQASSDQVNVGSSDQWAAATPQTGGLESAGPRNRPHTGGISVLLVEDNIVNCKLAVLILERIGCQVDVACNGAEGVEKFKANTYAAIFMDCQMPVMDGYEATQAIREWEAGNSHIPIIAVTANAMKGDKEKCLECGMDAYISKPLRPNDLQNAVSEWCQVSV